MKVVIDGDEYVKYQEPVTDRLVLKALEFRLQPERGDNRTIREYLYMLLLTLWEEQEGFSGKRPFGNGGWGYDLYTPLIREGLVQGELDEDGFVDSVDRKSADAYVATMIKALCYGAQEGSV